MMATKRQTAKALEGSIEKWAKIVARKGVDDGHLNCPLCTVFIGGNGCEGCPVADSKESWGCSNTPIDRWYKHQARKHAIRGENLCPTCTRFAKAELKFLESLRTGA